MNNPTANSYYAFLPLAHTFELIAEMVFLGAGIRIGYGSAPTMVDDSPGLKPGVAGDLKLLQPTIMCSVPLVLDRVRKKITDRFSTSVLKQQLFQLILNYKNSWRLWGMDTPILNRLICKKAQANLGGKVQTMIVGGAPLSPETQAIIQNFMNIRVLVVSESVPKSIQNDFKMSQF